MSAGAVTSIWVNDLMETNRAQDKWYNEKVRPFSVRSPVKRMTAVR